MKRPFGVTLLALLLAWLALGGIALGLLSPALAKVGLPWALYGVAGVAYGAAALAAAIGLWRLAPWAHWAFQGWIVTALAAGSLPLLTMGSGTSWWWILPLGWALLLAILLPLASYVQRSVRAAA